MPTEGQTEDLLRDFVETAQVGLHWVAEDGTIRWANPADYEPLGYSADEYVGHNIAEFHVDAPVIADILRRLTAGERLHEYPARLRCKDGSIRQVLITSSVKFDEEGRFQHTRCFTVDVTSRAPRGANELQLEALCREVERLSLSASEDRGLLESIFDVSPYGIIVCDAHGRLTVLNKAAERIWAGSATAEGVTDWSKYRAYHPDGRPYQGADWAMARCLTTGETVQPERMKIQRFDDTFAVVLGGSAPIRGATGEIQGAVSIFAEVTRYQAIEEALELSAARYHTTLASIGDAVIATDPTGAITFMNPVAERLTGWRLDEATGRPLAEVFAILNEHTGKAVESPVDKVLREGEVVALANHTVLVARDGARYAIDDSGAPIHDERGELAGVVLVFRDVTEKRREEIRRAFIAEASTILAASLDTGETLTTVARLAVPRLADWCAVDLVDGDALERLAVAHVDPAKIELVERLQRQYPSDPAAPRGVHAAVRSGTAELIPVIPEEALVAAAIDPEHLRLIRALGLRSWMVVPLKTQGRTLGAITFASAESGRTFGDADLALAEELASCAALAVANATSFAAAQEAVRNQAEIAAERTSLVMQMPVAASLVRGPAHVYELVNRRYREMVGRDDLVGKAYLEAFPELAGTAILDVLDTAYRTGESFVAEEFPVDLPGPDGERSRRYFRFSVEPLRDASGAVYGLISVAVEVTESVRSRLALERAAVEKQQLLERESAARAAAEQSGREFQMLIDSIPQLAWTADSEGWIDFYNRGWYGYTGTTLEVMRGWGWKSVHDPERVEEVEARWRMALRSGQPFEMEFRLRGADGVLRWFLTRAVPVRDADGRIVRWFGTNTLIEEITHMRRELEDASRAKDEFLAMLGHELRNPLAPIQTALHLMRLRGQGSTEREQAIIGRQVQHLVRLVDDLLDVSRITRGKVELDRVDVEVSEIVARAIEIASPLIEQKNHRLTVDVPPVGLVVEADVARLAQVVANLLHNAAKYTDRGGSIRVHATGADGTVELTVADSGIGIRGETLPRVFDLFTQEPQALDRSQGGLGLGLAIAKSLTTMHGGRVEAASDGPGSGSTFTVFLPRVVTVVDASASRTPRDERSPLEAPRTGRRRSILVVDDNRDAADLLAETFASVGHDARVAYDGPSALELVGRFRPDVAFLDIGLPVMDGYELVRRMKERPDLRSTRFIALTGYGQATDRETSRAAGFDEHLVKPVQISVLLPLLETPDLGSSSS